MKAYIHVHVYILSLLAKPRGMLITKKEMITQQKYAYGYNVQFRGGGGCVLFCCPFVLKDSSVNFHLAKRKQFSIILNVIILISRTVSDKSKNVLEEKNTAISGIMPSYQSRVNVD